MTRSIRRAVSLGLLLATIGCSGGLNCGSGCADAYPYPQSTAAVPNGTQFVDNGVRMRLTQDALDFLVANLQPILATQLGNDPTNPDLIVVPIPDQAFGGNFALGIGEKERRQTRAVINGALLAETMSVQLVENPQGVLISVDDLPFGIDGRVYGELDGFADAACDIRGVNPAYGGFPFVTGISFEILVSPRVGRGSECDEAGGQGECLKIDIDVRRIGIGDFGSQALEVETPPTCAVQNAGDCSFSGPDACPFGSQCFHRGFGNAVCVGDGEGACSEDCSDNCLDVTCGVSRNPADGDGNNECATACAVTDFFVDVFAEVLGFISGLIEPLLDDVLERALIDALENVDGAPLSSSGRLDVAGFAPGILPVGALDLGFAIAPTGNAFDVNTPAGGALGIDVILKSGFEAAPPLQPVAGEAVPHPCVLPIEGVEFGALYGGRTEFFVPQNIVTPLSGTYNGGTYHLGASVAKATINQTLFGLYNTGALCIELTSDAVNDVTGGAFQLSAGTLDLLTQGKLKEFAAPDAPAIVTLNPSQPPVISYGAGTIDEGHIIVTWPNVEVGFYVLMYERFSRVFAVAADISLQVSVFNDPGTETLRIAVIDGPTVGNFRENFNELLPGVSFTEVLESLVGVVFDAALGDGLEFNYDVGSTLSDLLGVPVFIDFQGIETAPSNQREVLNVYLSMTSTQPQSLTVGHIGPRLAADPGTMRVPDAEDFGTTTRAVIPTGEARIEVDGENDVVREFFARVDFGAWRGPLVANDGVIVVRDSKLRLSGAHEIWIRSRIAGAPNTLEPADEATSVTVFVDGLAPQVRLERQGDVVVAIGHDDVTAAVDLEYAWQLDDGELGPFGALDRLPLDQLEARRVRVVAKDQAGHTSKPSAIDVVIERRRQRQDRELRLAADAGCAQTSTDTSAALCALALGCLVRRRRRPTVRN